MIDFNCRKYYVIDLNCRKYYVINLNCRKYVYLFFFVQVIEAIANAIASTEGCSLLDVDPGASTNRTVYTFVGSPEAVVEGALCASRVAYQTIDMRMHQGTYMASLCWWKTWLLD